MTHQAGGTAGAAPTDAVVRKAVEVERSPEDAFRIFTVEISTWWPLATHSVAREDAATCVFESREGGRIFERTRAGDEILWGTVVAYEPPHRLVYTWHPGRDEGTAQEVEMHFRAVGDGTRVEVEHRGWERYGDQVDEAVRSYETGWDLVLSDRFAKALVRL